MQVIATTANRNRTRVWPKIWKILPGLRPRRRAARIAAKKQPVPVAVSQLKSKRAASAVAFCTTGTVRNTLACKYGQSHPAGPGRGLPSGIMTLKAGVVAWFIANFTAGKPQTSTMTERNAKGSPDLAVLAAEEGFGNSFPRALAARSLRSA